MKKISHYNILLLIIIPILFNNCIDRIHSIDIIDEHIDTLIVHGSECIMNVISKHFRIGTNIALIRSGLQNYSTNKVLKYTPDATLDLLMGNPKWTVIIKQKIGYHIKKFVIKN